MEFGKIDFSGQYGKRSSVARSRQKARSEKFDLHTGPETKTQQHFGDEVDINTIVRRFGITGQMPFGSAQGFYGDFTGITDYDDALDKIREAEEKFMKLPPDVRERFNNDPAEMVRQASSLEEAEFMARVTPQPEVRDEAAGSGEVV